MEEYAIKYSDGKAPPDGGKAQWVEHQRRVQSPGDASPEPEPEAEPEPEPQATPAMEEGEEVYITKDKDTFNDVCNALGVDRAEQRVYFDWLKSSHQMGNDKRTCTKLFFPNPIGKVNKLTKFNAGVHFPVPTGEDWESHTA
eukprot:COSAG02_NODE_10878_length_1839_cov_12.364368_1_plen_142_part_00